MTKRAWRSYLGAALFAMAAFVAADSASTGQEPAPLPKLATDREPKKDPDPTNPGPELRKILETPKETKTPAKTSEIRLKGRVISPQLALVSLDIDGVTYLLPVGGEARSVKVLEISATGVKIEVAPRKEVRVLH